MTPAALVAAAGASTRMGQPKALLRWRGEPLVHRLARVMLAAGAAPCVVTLPEGAEAGAVAAALADLDLLLTPNQAPAAGLIGSVRTALDLVGERASALVLAPVDAPFIAVEDLQRLLAAARPPGAIAVPQIGDRDGHPVVFERGLFTALRSRAADRGAAALVAADPGRVVRVPCTDPRLLADLNTPEDARALGLELDLPSERAR